MKRNSFWRHMVLFFASIGLMTMMGLMIIMVSNVNGVGTLASVYSIVRTESLYETTQASLIEGAMRGIVNTLDDTYSVYLNEKEWKELNIGLTSRLSGIGVRVKQTDTKDIVVHQVVPGSPADKKGLKEGDIIIRVQKLLAKEVSLDDLIDEIRGEKGTSVSVSVYRPTEGIEHSFEITRAEVQFPDVELAYADEKKQYAILKINQFSSGGFNEAKAQIEKLEAQNCRGIVMDLRDNPGGEFQFACDLADLFLTKGVIVQVQDRQKNLEVIRAKEGAVNTPLVILINGNSASSSEVFAAAMKDNNRAMVVGEKSFGKGVIQTIYPMRNGGCLKLTSEKYLTPDGLDINKKGVEPDITITSIGFKDLVLEKAIYILDSK